MLRVKPFQGLRSADDVAPLVASLPYDVVDSAEAAALVNDNPYSLLHVERAEIDLPAGTDPYSSEVYEKARETFEVFQAQEILVPEGEPAVYLYQLTMGDHVQIGIALTCYIGDYEQNVIKKHEATSPNEVEDRARLIGTLGANTAPVFLTYRDTPDLNALTAEVVKGAPLYDFISPDEIGHTVWRVPGVRLAEFFINAFAQVPCAYIVDGHHLAASAVRVGRERRAERSDATGDEPYNWFLCVLVPASQVKLSAAGAAAGAPTTVEELMDLVDAGKMMPPKTTQCEPKLRSGLFIHTL